MEVKSRTTVGDLSVAAVMVIFGLTFIANKVALREIQPFTLALMRFALASIILLPVSRAKQNSAKNYVPWKKITLMGATGVTAFFVLQNLGLVFTTASNASLILASIPAFTAVTSMLSIKEKVPMQRWIGIALSIFGVGLIVSSNGFFLSPSILGEILVLGAAIMWAVYTVLGRHLNLQLSPLMNSTYSIATGTLLLIPFAAYEYIQHGIPAISLESWTAVIYLGGVGSAAAFFLYNYGLARIDASRAAVYTNLPPLVAVATGIIYLGESFHLIQLLGGVFILSGIYICQR